MGVNSLPKTVIRQRRGCDLNPSPSAPESSTLATRLRSHPSLFTLIATFAGRLRSCYTSTESSWHRQCSLQDHFGKKWEIKTLNLANADLSSSHGVLTF